MTGWIEISLTLRNFSASPEKISTLLGDHRAEIRRAGDRVNNVSKAVYTDSSVRIENNLPLESNISDHTLNLLESCGGSDAIRLIIKEQDVKFIDFDVVIYADGLSTIPRSLFIDEHAVEKLSCISASISLTIQP